MDNQRIVEKKILYGSSDYDAALELRHKVLRKPLGKDLYVEDLTQEENQEHLGIFKGENLVAVLILIPIDAKNIRMRQVAVEEGLRGQGLGRKLITFAEKVAKARGFQTVSLNARVTSQAFYCKKEYCKVGVPFMELGILHIKMTKEL